MCEEKKVVATQIRLPAGIHEYIKQEADVKLYTGHCKCEVPAKKQKGKSRPTPEDTCLCFEENGRGRQK